MGMADERNGIPKLVNESHLLQLAGSLQKVDGVYAHGMWLCDDTAGTFCYEASGADYWLAASKPLEVQSVHSAREALGSYSAAVEWLAHNHPKGIRDQQGEIQPFSTDMLEA